LGLRGLAARVASAQFGYGQGGDEQRCEKTQP
jgi:hypothetical protein